MNVLLPDGETEQDGSGLHVTAWALGRYPLKMSEGTRERLRRDVGLCSDCRFMRRIESDRGSIFHLCERSATDARFPKYPRLPVLQCAGYEALDADLEHGDQA
jgi:hypothetical protein